MVGSFICQFPQAPGMHGTGPHRPVPVQFHQGVSNLLFTYSRRDFAPPASIYRFRESRDMGSLTVSED